MPRSVAASMMVAVACPRSYMSRSWWRASSGCPTTKAIVAAERATCRAPCQTFASSTSCGRSVTTTKFHGCQLLADAALRPASRMRSRSARAIGWSVYWRTLRRARMVSQVSMSQLYACTPAQEGCRLWCAQNRGWSSSSEPLLAMSTAGKPDVREPLPAGSIRRVGWLHTGGMSTRERGVGGGGHGVLLLSLGQHLEEQLGSTAVEFPVAEFVDAEKIDSPFGIVLLKSMA